VCTSAHIRAIQGRDPPDLTCIKRSGRHRLLDVTMDRLIIFWCPAAGVDVQTLWPPHDREEKHGPHYESVTCPSCTRLHFVNRKTGALLGYEKDSG
jgi:hypothetical protein